jgi:hypothetical protein
MTSRLIVTAVAALILGLAGLAVALVAGGSAHSDKRFAHLVHQSPSAMALAGALLMPVSLFLDWYAIKEHRGSGTSTATRSIAWWSRKHRGTNPVKLSADHLGA